MNITQLEYFMAASRTLNYTQAANRMFTSRQNLSHAVKELERELDAKLFYHDKGALRLTPEGEEAAQRVGTILSEVEKLKVAFSQPGKAADPLKILIGTNIFSFSPYDITDFFERFREEDIRFGELDCKECYECVLQERADLALLVCMPREFEGCASALLHSDRLYLLVNAESELAAKENLRLSDLAGQSLMMPPGYEFQFEPLLRKIDERGMRDVSISPISSFSVVRRRVEAGSAMGIASSLFKEHHPEGTAVCTLVEPGCEMSLYALYRKDSAHIKAVLDLVAELQSTVSMRKDGPHLDG